MEQFFSHNDINGGNALTIKANEVLEYIRPSGGWATYGDNFEDILFIDCEPLTKDEFNEAAKVAEKELKAKAKAKAEQKQAILDRLGLTAEEAQLLLGGN